ncbi:CCA tRNA nucleotidyltransferase [Lysinibacillus sp. 54212]|uniref:CCA tRNA nucleotidyltransferase n=1 Tax=Lysinibacillus sp. 54212 TaxID=3119829 RepID=UPI002FCC14E0
MTQQWKIAENVIHKIQQAGFEAVFVGGAVRDRILNREQHDIDVATSALPSEIKTIFTKTVDVGIEHGTVLVLDEGAPIEVTTYRTDGTYDDHRRPDSVVFVRSLKDDLERRDFTMNAIAMTASYEIIDYYGGISDIEQRLIRAVGQPQKRFQEDALRMLRAVRFRAQLGFAIENETFTAIKKQAQDIQHIAMERISAELNKIWISDNVFEGIVSLVQSNLANYLPGNFMENLEKWKYCKFTSPSMGWAYLCFLNREQHASIVKAYRLSNKEKNYVQNVLRAYDALLQGWSIVDYFETELSVLEGAYDFAEWQGIELSVTKDQIALIKASLPIESRKDLQANGNDFMEWTNKKRGPWLKDALDKVLLAVLNGSLDNNPDQIREWFLHEFDEG